MMQGYVNQNYEATILVVIFSFNKTKSKPINAIIDTGFSGFLSLPNKTINELGLSWSYRDRGTLGDGSEVIFDIYNSQVIWNGQVQDIEVNSAETEPLIGMSLLRGFSLNIDTGVNGLVTIQKLDKSY